MDVHYYYFINDAPTCYIIVTLQPTLGWHLHLQFDFLRTNKMADNSTVVWIFQLKIVQLMVRTAFFFVNS